MASKSVYMKKILSVRKSKKKVQAMRREASLSLFIWRDDVARPAAERRGIKKSAAKQKRRQILLEG